MSFFWACVSPFSTSNFNCWEETTWSTSNFSENISLLKRLKVLTKMLQRPGNWFSLKKNVSDVNHFRKKWLSKTIEIMSVTMSDKLVWTIQTPTSSYPLSEMGPPNNQELSSMGNHPYDKKETHTESYWKARFFLNIDRQVDRHIDSSYPKQFSKISWSAKHLAALVKSCHQCSATVFWRWDWGAVQNSRQMFSEISTRKATLNVKEVHKNLLFTRKSCFQWSPRVGTKQL